MLHGAKIFFIKGKKGMIRQAAVLSSKIPCIIAARRLKKLLWLRGRRYYFKSRRQYPRMYLIGLSHVFTIYLEVGLATRMYFQ